MLPEIGTSLFGSTSFKIASVRRSHVLCPKCRERLFNIRTKYPPAHEFKCNNCNYKS